LNSSAVAEPKVPPLTYITSITHLTTEPFIASCHSITIDSSQPSGACAWSVPACVDLLIVGGGINGAGIARDAAGRGLSVTLLEQADLASGTSSASTKLIHGGLRYLEFFELRLVRESLQERERLLALAPHIIVPMQFVLPHAPGLRPRWQIRLGLFLYDHIGGRERLPASRAVDLHRPPYAETLHPHLRHGFVYSDCWVDDSRLVVLNAIDAAQRGAQILTRTRFISAHDRDGIWRVVCEDVATQRRFDIRARAIVNAAGPWVERVIDGVPDVAIATKIRLVKGSHIVVPRLFDSDTTAFLLQHPDKRVVFAIPYERSFTLIGTTDLAYTDDPAVAAITEPEVRYLCETASEYFRRPVVPGDVRWTYAGVRPLLDDASENISQITRDYRLELTRGPKGAPLLSIFGGKITTYRRLAEAALTKLLHALTRRGPSWTATAPLPGGDLPNASFEPFAQEVTHRWSFLPSALAHRLARAYGTRIERILGASTSMAQLGEHFGAGLTEAEVEYLRSYEWARFSDDVLWRRTKLGLHMNDAEQARLRSYLGE
jgi:Glycerol-3-phosphate dehydrogenase